MEQLFDDLEDFGSFDDAISGDVRDPYTELARLRREEPVQRLETSGALPHEESLPMFIVYRHEDVQQMLRDNALQQRLPDPPPRKGIHWFWASLTNTANSIMWYMRLGYKPVKFEEMPGWADANMRGKSGEFAGCITVEEMLLMRGDEKAYQRFMQIVHHDKPMEEQKGVRDSFRRAREEVTAESGHDGIVRDATRPGETSGLKELERTVKRPAKFE